MSAEMVVCTAPTSPKSLPQDSPVEITNRIILLKD